MKIDQRPQRIHAGHPRWRDSAEACAPIDGNQCLGYVIRRGEWQAYGGTADDRAASERQLLGIYESLAEAKIAAEEALIRSKRNEIVLGANAIWNF
jgi:hypothetical protein